MGFAFVQFEEVHNISEPVAGKPLPPEALVLKRQGQRRAVFAKIRTLMPRSVFDPGQKRDCVVMFLKDLSEAFQSLLPDAFADFRTRPRTR
jgi:hypothetical protein